MLKIKINKEHQIELPQHEGEMTLQFYLDFLKLDTGDELSFLSGITGISKEELQKTNNTKLDDLVYSALSFLNQDFANHIDSLAVPHYLRIGERKYRIPKDLEFETLGQKIEAKKLIQEAENVNDVIAELITIYLQSVSSDREVLKRKIFGCLAVDILPIARFFFLKFRGSVISGQQHLEAEEQKKNQPQTLQGSTSSGN